MSIIFSYTLLHSTTLFCTQLHFLHWLIDITNQNAEIVARMLLSREHYDVITFLICIVQNGQKEKRHYSVFWKAFQTSISCFSCMPYTLKWGKCHLSKMISPHVRITPRFYLFVTTRYTTDVYIMMFSFWCRHCDNIRKH